MTFILMVKTTILVHHHSSSLHAIVSLHLSVLQCYVTCYICVMCYVSCYMSIQLRPEAFWSMSVDNAPWKFKMNREVPDYRSFNL